MRSLGQLAIFLGVMTLVVGGIHYYLYSRLVRAPGLGEGAQRWGAILFTFLALLVPLGILVSRSLPRPFATIVGYAAFGWMGLSVLLFFLTLGAEVLRAGAAGLGAARLLSYDPERRTFFARLLAGGVGAIGLGLAAYGVAVARGDARIERVTVRLGKLPEALRGLTIAQLTDVHVGPTIDKTFIERVVAQTNALSPDVIVITGDLVDGSVEELREHVAPLARLRAKHGVFFVTGNHEYYSGVDEWIAELERLGIRVLRNERVAIGEGDAVIDLAGVDDWSSARFGRGHGPSLDAALAGRDPTREVILLAHQPKQAHEAQKRGVGLQLSGHTHGGQIFPWGLFVKIDQPFIAGLDRLGDFQIYTSRGTGYWGPPMRVGAPPEIALLTLEPDTAVS